MFRFSVVLAPYGSGRLPPVTGSFTPSVLPPLGNRCNPADGTGIAYLQGPHTCRSKSGLGLYATACILGADTPSGVGALLRRPGELKTTETLISKIITCGYGDMPFGYVPFSLMK
jgi:hypothetical protein